MAEATKPKVTFGQAFKTARSMQKKKTGHGAGGTFSYKGKSYTTNQKEEVGKKAKLKPKTKTAVRKAAKKKAKPGKVSARKAKTTARKSKFAAKKKAQLAKRATKKGKRKAKRKAVKAARKATY